MKTLPEPSEAATKAACKILIEFGDSEERLTYSDCATLARIIDSECSLTEWKPIETAPKNGATILVTWAKEPTWGASTARWSESEKGWIEPSDEDGGCFKNLTHWMPLPPAPTPDREPREG